VPDLHGRCRANLCPAITTGLARHLTGGPMTNNAASGRNRFAGHAEATDLSHFERHNYSGDREEQAAFERLVRLCKEVARRLRANGPGVGASLAAHVCWASPLFTAEEPLVSALAQDLAHTEFTYAFFPAHSEDLTAAELEDIADAVQHWLDNPSFEAVDQAELD